MSAFSTKNVARSFSIVVFLIVSQSAVNAQSVAKTACEFQYDSVLKKPVYTKVDIEPQFPGGPAALQRFYQKNLRYPGDSSENPKSTTRVSFIVDSDGAVLDLKVPGIRPEQYGPLDKEYIRLLRSSPKWEPALCNGKPVAFYHTMQLYIHLSGE